MRKLFLTLSAIFCLLISTIAQNRTITGRVTDANSQPVAGASVLVKGTRIGTTTNSEGTYSLSVPANARTLQISSVNMATQDVTIRGTSVDVALAANTANNLQEVVVVGYGTQTKKQVTAAISKIDPTPIANMVTPSIDKQLGGRSSGVLVTNPSGSVNEPPRIRIRGVNSINGSSAPLFVLDGIPVPSGGFSGYTTDNLLSNINPADVESIEVLKDGSATAIYGSRGANGVILITTKKGKAGKLNLNYSANFGFSSPYKKFDLLNAQEFVTIANEKLTNAGLPSAAFMNNENTNTDWQSIVFRDPAISKTHTLSLEGGTERTNYFFSLNYADLKGLVTTNLTKRYNIRANIEQRFNKWLKVTNYITLSRTDDADQNTGGNALSGAIAGAIRALPNVRVMNPNQPQFDFYNVTPDGAALGMDSNKRVIENNYTNIGFVLAHNKFISTKYRVINNFGLEIKPVSWLTYNFRGNVDLITLSEFLAYDARHGDGRSVLGRVQNQGANNLRWVLQNYINANKSFGGHNFFFTLGTENQMQKSNSFQAIGTNVADPFYQQYNVISGSYATQQSSGTYTDGPGFVSYFARLNYDFANKYFLQGTVRRDGLSRFAPNKRFGTFPGISAGYRISQEGFWKSSPLKFISDLKFRGSWAKVGNTEIAGGNFPYLNLYSLAPYGAISGVSASLIGNSDLEWETNEKIDFGADIALLNNRLNITFDYYENKDNNLVLAAPQPPSLGIPGNQIFKNIGNMINKGFEFSANSDVVRSKALVWNVGVNFTHQTNKVLSLFNNADVIVSNGTGNYNILRVGEPINALYGFQFAGVSSANGNPVYYKPDGSLVMGNIPNSSYFIVKDINDGTLGAASSLTGADRVVLGNTLPTYFGGITSSLSFKGFAIDILFRYAGGNKIMNLTRQESLLSQGFTNNGREILDRWTKPGAVTTVPRLWYGRDNFINLTQQAVSRFVEKGDFFRLDNLNVSYNFPTATLSRVFGSNVKGIKFYVQGQNLWVSTKYTGIDPDNIDSRGLDYNVIPAARTISVGLNVGF